jgi:hypothetical protein
MESDRCWLGSAIADFGVKGLGCDRQFLGDIIEYGYSTNVSVW